MRRLTIFLQFFCFIYFLAITWLNFFPWNDIHSAQLFLGEKYTIQLVSGSIMTSIPLLLAIYAFSKRKRKLMIFSTFLCGGLLMLQFSSNWFPYLFGASDQAVHLHLSLFSNTLTSLPAIGSNPIPDNAHVMLGLLYLLVVLFMVIVLKKKRPAPKTMKG